MQHKLPHWKSKIKPMAKFDLEQCQIRNNGDGKIFNEHYTFNSTLLLHYHVDWMKCHSKFAIEIPGFHCCMYRRVIKKPASILIWISLSLKRLTRVQSDWQHEYSFICERRINIFLATEPKKKKRLTCHSLRDRMQIGKSKPRIKILT